MATVPMKLLQGGAEAARQGRGGALRRRLSDAGPLAAAFGRYLGSRVDLLPAADCLPLLEIADRGPSAPTGAVSGLIGRELGVRPQGLFRSFAPDPFACGLLFQWHLAELAAGEPVTVQLMRPELADRLSKEPGTLRRALQRLVAGSLPAGAARGAVAEFERGLDLRRWVEGLEKLADEAAGAPRLEVPAAYRELCSERVLVRTRVEGDGAVSAAAASHDERRGETQARRLCRTWLRLALSGGPFPVEPWGRNVRFLEDGRVAFVGGEVARVPRALRDRLRDYLAASAAQEPDRAARALLELLPSGAETRRLRSRVRHTDPFRDRRWDVGGDLFARQLLAQRRAVELLGVELPARLGPFYRGLFLLSREARRLAGDAEVVRNGFREARLLLLAEELGRADAVRRATGELERQMAWTSSLPRKLNRMLTLLAEEEWERGERRRGPEARGGGLLSRVVGALMAMAGVVAVTRHLAADASLAGWAEAAGAVAVVGLGALLLRSLARSGGTR